MRTSALLVALLACAAAFAGGAAASACDGVSCGMGTCKELPPPPISIPILSNVSSYECDCDPGWINFVPLAKFTACYIATCSPLAFSCYIPAYKVPGLSNLTLHPCDGMNCGPGTCVEEPGKPLRCQCDPGTANLLDNPSFPCVDKDCVIGKDGCPVPSPPPSPPSPASPGNDNHSSGPTAPSSTKGSVCLHNLLLLAFLAALHVVV